MALFSKKQTNIPKRREVTHGRITEENLSDKYAFRRNRTLTGSMSSQVMSTNETGAQLKSSRVQAHELVKKRRHLGGILFLVLGTVVVLLALIYQFTAGVVVKAQDVSMQLDVTYEKAIQEYFSKQPIQRLRFLLNEEALGGYLRTVTPEVASVKNDGNAGFGKSAFIVTMRTPIAAWKINGDQQYVDTTGTAFSRNYFTTPPVQIVDNTGVEVTTGQAVASNRFLGFVGRVVGFAKTSGYSVQQVIIPAGTTRQVELRLEGVGYPIKFSVDRGAGGQVEDMVRSLRWFSGRNIAPKYLDVRVSGKAFYQ